METLMRPSPIVAMKILVTIIVAMETLIKLTVARETKLQIVAMETLIKLSDCHSGSGYFFLVVARGNRGETVPLIVAMGTLSRL